jgi:hypothetical protein
MKTSHLLRLLAAMETVTMTGVKWEGTRSVMVSLCLYSEILKERKKKELQESTVHASPFPQNGGGVEDTRPGT